MQYRKGEIHKEIEIHSLNNETEIVFSVFLIGLNSAKMNISSIDKL